VLSITRHLDDVTSHAQSGAILLHFSLFRHSPQPRNPAPALAESGMRLRPGTTFVIIVFVVASPDLSGHGNPIG